MTVDPSTVEIEIARAWRRGSRTSAPSSSSARFMPIRRRPAWARLGSGATTRYAARRMKRRAIQAEQRRADEDAQDRERCADEPVGELVPVGVVGVARGTQRHESTVVERRARDGQPRLGGTESRGRVPTGDRHYPDRSVNSDCSHSRDDPRCRLRRIHHGDGAGVARPSRRVRRHRHAARSTCSATGTSRSSRTVSRTSSTRQSTPGTCSFSADPPAAVVDADVVFLCVPTPSDDDGRADLSYITAARRDDPRHAARPVRSSSTSRPCRSARRRSSSACCNATTSPSCPTPSSCARARRVHDFLHPDRVVVGSDSPDAAETVARLYEALDATVLITDPASAETIKYAANAFLATKISFVNAVAAMCEAVGADVERRDRRHRLRSPHRAGLPPPRSWLGWQLLPEGHPCPGHDRRRPRLRLRARARRDRGQRGAAPPHRREDPTCRRRLARRRRRRCVRPHVQGAYRRPSATRPGWRSSTISSPPAPSCAVTIRLSSSR